MDKIYPTKKNEDLNKFTLFNEEDTSEICQDETDTPGKEIKKVEHPNPELEKKIMTIMNELVEKYLENRKYINSKVNNWIEALLNDLNERLINEKGYKFISTCFIIKRPIHYCCSSMNRKNLEKDGIIRKKYIYETFICTISIGYFSLKENPKEITNLDNIQKDIINESEKIKSNILDGREYNPKTNSKYKDYILFDIRKYIHNKIVNVRSYNLCFLIKKGCEFNFNYKAINAGKEKIIIDSKNEFNNIIIKTLNFIFN